MALIQVDGLLVETEPYSTKENAKASSPWISVVDSLPPDNHEVMYFAITDDGNKEIMIGHRQNDVWTHCCMFYSTIVLNDNVDITHWMELQDYP